MGVTTKPRVTAAGSVLSAASGSDVEFDWQERAHVGVVAIEPGQIARPGDECHSPALLRDERPHDLPHAARQQPRIDVADHEHVVLEQFVAADRQSAERRLVLLGVFGVGILQVGGKLDRGIALQQRFQKAKLVARIAVDHEHADFLVADGDDAPLAIVFLVCFIVARAISTT